MRYSRPRDYKVSAPTPAPTDVEFIISCRRPTASKQARPLGKRKCAVLHEEWRGA